MKDLLSRAPKIARRSAPVAVVAAAVAFPLGAFAGHGARMAISSESPSFTFAVSRRAVTLDPGARARVRIVVHRQAAWERVVVQVASRLPRGISAQFAPAQTSGPLAFLTLRASLRAVAGRYRVRLSAAGGRVRRGIVLTLTVAGRTGRRSRNGEPWPFAISGNASSPLEPGSPQPIDVQITNPNPVPLTFTSLTVSIQQIDAPRASAALPCTPSDFAAQPYSGAPLTVAAASTQNLSELGVNPAQWPEVSILDRPSNQDGCQGASLSLALSANARVG
jgi:hypothetical protein